MDLLKALIRSAGSHWLHRGHAAHANRRKPGEPPPTSVHVGWLTQLGGPLVAIPLAAIAALIWLDVFSSQPIQNGWITALFFSAVAIWFGLGSYDAFVRRIEWTETYVRFRKWNSDRVIGWTDIVGLVDKSYPPHVRIVFRDGTGFGISETMNGSRYFLHIVERRLTPDDTAGGKRQRRRRRAKKS